MPDESSMNHQRFESMPSARPQSFPGAASSMTVPTRGNPFRGKPSGAFIASSRSAPFPDSVSIFIISASFVRMRRSIPAWLTRGGRRWVRVSGVKPRPGLQADVASGGGPGRTLKSFYPLFPKFAYFTEASINAPINFIDVFPSVTIQPWRDFAVLSGVDLLWRYSTHDAFYQPPGIPLVPGSANGKRFLGEQFYLHAEWQATPHININAAYVHFLTDGFLKAANAKDIDFL